MTTPTPTALSRLERLGGYLRTDPDNLSLLRDYATEALDAGEYRAGIEALRRAATLQAPSLDERLALAQALRRDGRSEEALSELGKDSGQWPGHPWVALETALCLFAQRAFHDALDALVDPPADDPLAGDVTALRIRLLHHLGQLDDAAALVDRAGDTPAPAVARAGLPVLVDQSRLEDALSLAASLVDAQPPGSATPYEVCEPFAAAALDAGEAEVAREWTHAALAQRQDDGRMWLLEGLARLAANAAREAIDPFQRAASLMPTHAGSHLALGWACIAAGDLTRARGAFEDGVAADPNFAEGHGSLAVLAAMQHQAADAETLIRKAQRLDAQCASALWARQLLHGRTGTDEVSRLASLIVAQARRSNRPRAPSSH